MFLGQFEHSIDEKGRLTIPARFRDLLAEGAFITRGFDRNLMVLTSSSFDQLYQRINQKSMTDLNARLLKRLIFSNADKLEFDKAGRILIPQFLRQSASLAANVVIVGVGDYFEIWSQDCWNEQAALLQDAEATSQRFAALDLSAGL
jgi:MraZ protein